MFSCRRSSKMKWKTGFLWTICRNGISKRERFGSFQRQVYLLIYFLRIDFKPFWVWYFCEKHLLFRSVTLITIADKSRCVMFCWMQQGIACFFLPSQLSFSKEKLSMFQIPQYRWFSDGIETLPTCLTSLKSKWACTGSAWQLTLEKEIPTTGCIFSAYLHNFLFFWSLSWEWQILCPLWKCLWLIFENAFLTLECVKG